MFVHSSGGIRYYTSDDTVGEPYSEGANCPRPDMKSGDLDMDEEETPPKGGKAVTSFLWKYWSLCPVTPLELL